MKRQWYLADKLAEHIRRRAKFPPSEPLDITTLARAYPFQADTQPAPIEADGDLLVTPSGPVIRYRRDHPRQRQRFTIAHELTHLVLQNPALGDWCFSRETQIT